MEFATSENTIGFNLFCSYSFMWVTDSWKIRHVVDVIAVQWNPQNEKCHINLSDFKIMWCKSFHITCISKIEMSVFNWVNIAPFWGNRTLLICKRQVYYYLCSVLVFKLTIRFAYEFLYEVGWATTYVKTKHQTVPSCSLSHSTWRRAKSYYYLCLQGEVHLIHPVVCN